MRVLFFVNLRDSVLRFVSFRLVWFGSVSFRFPFFLCVVHVCKFVLYVQHGGGLICCVPLGPPGDEQRQRSRDKFTCVVPVHVPPAVCSSEDERFFGIDRSPFCPKILGGGATKRPKGVLFLPLPLPLSRLLAHGLLSRLFRHFLLHKKGTRETDRTRGGVAKLPRAIGVFFLFFVWGEGGGGGGGHDEAHCRLALAFFGDQQNRTYRCR